MVVENGEAANEEFVADARGRGENVEVEARDGGDQVFAEPQRVEAEVNAEKGDDDFEHRHLFRRVACAHIAPLGLLRGCLPSWEFKFCR